MENWRTTLLSWFNITDTHLSWVEQLAYAAVILLVVVVIDRIGKIILNNVLSKIVRASKAKWDDILLDQKVLNKLVAILPAILLVLFLPFVFVGNESLYILTQRLCWIYLVGAVLAFIVSLIMGVSSLGMTALACSLWLLGGIQLLALGIVGEYVGKIYQETKHRPRFIIEKTVIK